MQKNSFAHGGIRRRGFALPTVLISSVILLTMLAVAVGAVNSARVALQGQYYTQLAESAAQSGLEMAEACINEGYLTWDKPLRPGGDCYGSAAACTGDDCFVVKTADTRTTFEVAAPSIDGDVSTVNTKGKTERVRKSNGAVWKTYSSNLRMQDRVADVSPGEVVKWKQVAAGLSHTCAISTKGNVYCWGSNSEGQLGDGTTTSRSTPTPISRGALPSGVTADDISTGDNHTCIIGSNKLGYCWGSNGSGELGDGTTTRRTSPVAIQRGAMPADSMLVDLANTTLQYTCAIASNNRAYCWGSNAYGQLGDGTKTNRSTPVLVQQGAMPASPVITQLSGGGYHVCAVVANNSRVYCWGYNASGEGRLGLGTTVAESLSPAAVVQGALPAGLIVQSLSAGRFHTCVVASDSQSYCWGRNTSSQSGDGTITNNTSPAATVRGTMPADRIAATFASGQNHACAVASDNKVYCWGENGSGQLGDGTTSTRSGPQLSGAGAIPAGISITQLAAGGSHTCGLGTDSNIYCWGRGDDGRLGTGSTIQETVPAKVAPVYEKNIVPEFKKVALGNFHGCAIASNDKVYCWGGSNTSGQLGNGTTIASQTPVEVAQGAIPVDVVPQDIAVGDSYACLTASNGKVYCWGNNATGQLGRGNTANATSPVAVSQGTMPANSTVRQLSLANEHACALVSDGNVYCWGGLRDDFLESLGASITLSTTPTPLGHTAVTSGDSVASISSGTYRTCMLMGSGKVHCSTMNWDGDLNLYWVHAASFLALDNISPQLSVRQISVGSENICAVASDGWVYCRGSGGFGQLGNGTTTSSSVPVPVSRGAIPTGVTIRQVSLGSNHVCALASNKKTYCWGLGTSGQLGRGSSSNSSLPVAVVQGDMLAGLGVRQISTSYNSSCALAPDGNMYCWGNNNTGQLGGGLDSSYRISPGLVARGTLEPSVLALSLSTADHHTCSVATDGAMYCWGEGGADELANGVGTAKTPRFTSPGALPLNGNMPHLNAIASGGWHTCAVGANSKAYCWGLAFMGQIGDGGSSFEPTPFPSPVSQGAMPSGATVRQMASGEMHTCIIASDNKVYCWGSDGLSGAAYVPVATPQGALPTGAMARQLAAGTNHTCVIASATSRAYCWGLNGSGRLGNGTTTNSANPVIVSQGGMPSGALVQQVSAGGSHTCAISSDSKAYCWGLGTSGQLGRGSNTDSSTPVAVSQGAMPSGAIVRQIAAGGTHTCAIGQDYKVYCWGLGTSGQLGRGSTSNATTPVAVSGGDLPSNTLVKQISVGAAYSCALTFDGEVYCWGYNTSGQLGNGGTVNSTRPVRVDSFTPKSTYSPAYTLLGPRRFF